MTDVHDTTYESIAVMPDHRTDGMQLTRHLDLKAMEPGLPKIVRSDSGPEFIGKAMLDRRRDRNVNLCLIDPGKSNEDACIDSFTGSLRD